MAVPFLVGLAAADGDAKALGRLLKVLDIERSSERRKAPAKPMSSRARSRVPRSTLQDEVHHVIVFGLVLAL